MKIRHMLLGCLLAAGCNETASNKEATKSDAGTTQKNADLKTLPPVKKVPLYRDKVSTEPVAEYKEKTSNPLNDWYFSVKLYETPETFHYLMKLKYEEMEGDDTLKLPDFGDMPKPVIQKGPEQYSCIIGFMDHNNQFREYKKVYVKNNELKITALKHYAVATYERQQ